MALFFYIIQVIIGFVQPLDYVIDDMFIRVLVVIDVMFIDDMVTIINALQCRLKPRIRNVYQVWMICGDTLFYFIR